MNLHDILSDLIIEANAHILNTQATSLPCGLTIKVYVDEELLVHLALVRRDKFPTISEWNAVMEAWPLPLPGRIPKPKERIGRLNHTAGLVAVWRMPAPEMIDQIKAATELATQ